MRNVKNQYLLRLIVFIAALAAGGILCNMFFKNIWKNEKKQSEGLVEYFESMTGVPIKDFCLKEEGEITSSRSSEKVDLCFTLTEGGAEQVAKRLEEKGYRAARGEFGLPGLSGYQFSKAFREEDILGWYSIFETVSKPFGVKTSAETMIYVTKQKEGTEHIYVFK